jgi:acetyl/propionyl-CoA carboxylase alpha subunit
MKKLLIANRGEIAIRVLHAAKELGIRTVAVYSEADRPARHAALADEAVAIGESEPGLSYLDMDKVLDAAKSTGADAIHPGYGFLSERAEFAESCEREGICFVGPNGPAMRKLGAKIDAKLLAVANGVPVTPGYFQAGADDRLLKEKSAEIGYPVMLKASAGGGGRGMRIVRDPADFDSEIRIARDEALKGFGDDAMMVEKLVERPRHIEVQVLADHHGNAAALFERECSIQRRHQKLLEESPSPLPSFADETWRSMREAAVRLVEAAGYTSAGTVEFMVDEASGAFYFLEVNARLQVEHPVTEAVTGVDLVKWQLRIAMGDRLQLAPDLLAGDRSALHGHAIEARIVAEDPARNFLPAAGRLLSWVEPKRPGVRVDTGYGPGAEVPRHYDSLLAKVIAHAETRPEAIAKLREALMDFHVLGVPTNIEFLIEVLEHPEFKAGRFDTGFLDREFDNWASGSGIPRELAAIAARAGAAERGPASESRFDGVWDLRDSFRIASGAE